MKMPKDGTSTQNNSKQPTKANNSKKDRKKQQTANQGSPDLAENDDKATSAHQMQAPSNAPDSTPRRNSRIARVQMDGSIASTEDDQERQQNQKLKKLGQEQSSTKSPKTNGTKKKQEQIVIQDPTLAKKIAKYIAKKERKRKRRERFRQGPVPLTRQFSNDSLGDMSKSTIENLYGTVSVTGSTSKNLSPASTDRSISARSKTHGTIMGSIDLDDDNDLEESDRYSSSSSCSENDDLLRSAVDALEKYQNAYLSGQSDKVDYETDGSMDDDDVVDDTSAKPTDTVEPRRSSARKSGVVDVETGPSSSRQSGVVEDITADGIDKSREQLENESPKKSEMAKERDDDFIIKHIKKQASMQQLVSKRTSIAMDVDGHNASNTALDLLKWFPPEHIEINQKEQDCVSVDISLDLDLEDGTGPVEEDEDDETKEHDTKPQKSKHVERPESPLKRKYSQSLKSTHRNQDTPIEDDFDKSASMENQVVEYSDGRKKSRRCPILFGLTVLITAGVTALIIWVLSRAGVISISNDQDVETTQPPFQLSAMTSINYTWISQDVQIDFGNTTFSRLQDPWSPQTQAAVWFATEDPFLSFPLTNDVDLRKSFRQRYAMATFYYATNGPKSWQNQFRFLSPSHICDWTKSDGDIGGVFCHGETVLGITLPANNLDGSIPDEIWAFEDLQVLELDKNSIHGTIPEGISRLSRLQTLSLSGNPLNGTLPTSLGLLSNLTRLAVSDCELTGQLPDELANTSLDTLLLDGNGFVGTVPTAYSGLPLGEFNIQSNMLSGDLTNTICTIGTLEKATADCDVLCGCCVQCS